MRDWGNWLQLAGALVGMVVVAPALFRHPYAGFAGLRFTVAITMLVGAAAMAIFLINQDWLALGAVAAPSALIGWFGAGYLLKQMTEYARLTRRQRRRHLRGLPSFPLLAAAWVGAILTVIGVTFSAIG